MKTRSNCTVLAALMSFAVLASPFAAPAAVLRTWIGAGTDGLWITSANWTNGIRPAASNDVLFANSAPQRSTVNDLLTNLHAITFGGGGFSIVGNPLILTNG